MGVVSNLGAKSFAHNNQNYQDLDMFSYIPAICSSSVLQRLVGQEALGMLGPVDANHDVDVEECGTDLVAMLESIAKPE